MSLLGSLASCGRRGTFWPRKATTHGKRRVHQQDKRGHLNEGHNHSGKCLAGAQAKGRHRNGNCQLEVVTCRGKGNGGRVRGTRSPLRGQPQSS